MSLRTTISDAVERRRQRKQRTRELRQLRDELSARISRAGAATSEEIADKLAADRVIALRGLARRIPTEDRSRLAADIAALTKDDRFLLALAADGLAEQEIAEHFFRALKSIHLDLGRIFKALAGQPES